VVPTCSICAVGGRFAPLSRSDASGDHGGNPTTRAVHGAAAGQSGSGDSTGKKASVRREPPIRAIRPEAIIASLFLITGKSCRRVARQCLSSVGPSDHPKSPAPRPGSFRTGDSQASPNSFIRMPASTAIAAARRAMLTKRSRGAGMPAILPGRGEAVVNERAESRLKPAGSLRRNIGYRRFVPLSLAISWSPPFWAHPSPKTPG
jgi:hypothetical protein